MTVKEFSIVQFWVLLFALPMSFTPHFSFFFFKKKLKFQLNHFSDEYIWMNSTTSSFQKYESGTLCTSNKKLVHNREKRNKDNENGNVIHTEPSHSQIHHWNQRQWHTIVIKLHHCQKHAPIAEHQKLLRLLLCVVVLIFPSIGAFASVTVLCNQATIFELMSWLHLRLKVHALHAPLLFLLGLSSLQLVWRRAWVLCFSSDTTISLEQTLELVAVIESMGVGAEMDVRCNFPLPCVWMKNFRIPKNLNYLEI